MGPFAGRMVETVVLQQLDRQHAPQQTDDDDPYGDPQSSQLPDQQQRIQKRVDAAAKALTSCAHHIRATSEADGRFDL